MSVYHTDRRLVDQFLPLGARHPELHLVYKTGRRCFFRRCNFFALPICFVFLFLLIISLRRIEHLILLLPSNFLLQLAYALLHPNLAQLVIVAPFRIDFLKLVKNECFSLPDLTRLLVRHAHVAPWEGQSLQFLQSVLSHLASRPAS